MHWTSALAIVLGTAIYRGLVAPAQARYAAWKADPNRVPVARPNWHGMYVPDLTLIRMRRGYRALFFGMIVFAPLYLILLDSHGK